MSLKESQEKETNLKGTLISVSILGFVLIASWVGVFILFLSR
ncbi:cytochrome c oxidase subunit 2A [Oceanobacillus halophilus]|uniref:Cytochrome c oxidase subunit 2A n=1 Tax=Oceanobacillus halophilus TaxID=930130 RepID=A0A495ACM9_9BACI|nr:cytochrome c oxidase subunit 2A [Oceanobacillus halophilus]RKQ37622.1 cytochrome c oxidase subunit 2A [Oceanobacillus halophilus]